MLSYEKKYTTTSLANEVAYNFKIMDSEGKDNSLYSKEIFNNPEEAVENSKQVNKELISKLEAIYIVDKETTINQQGIGKDFNSILLVTTEEFERIISEESLKGVLSAKVIDLRKK